MPTWLQASVTLTSVLAVASCSAPPGALPLDDDGVDVPEFQGMLGSPGASTPQQPGAVTPAPNTGATGSTNTNGNPPPAAPSNNEQNGANGAPLTPGNTGANNNGANSGANNNGANNGAAGSSMVPPPSGNQGAGGSSMGGGENPSEPPPSDQEPPPVTQPPVTPPPVTPPPVTPSGPDIPCPADATFCSGFEGPGLPEGSVFQPTYLANEALGGQVELDTTVVHTGAQSLYLPVGANYYRMLAVPVPGSSFWVRLYTRSNVGFGADGSVHAALFLASTFAPNGDYNGDTAVEIAEQYDQVLLNVKDVTFGTGGVNPNGLPGTTLADNTWTCMETQFDGPTGAVRVFVEGEQIIDATGWQPPSTFNSFRFGYLRYGSPPRDVWMDDVVVAASRIGCQ